MDVSTLVLPSSGHVILTSTDSPTDFDLTFKKRYSMSNVGSLVTSIFLVIKQSPIICMIASVIVFDLQYSKASN